MTVKTFLILQNSFIIFHIHPNIYIYFLYLKKPQTSEQYCVKDAVHPNILLVAANYLQYYLLHVNPKPVCFLVSKISISDESSSMSVKL